MLAEDVSALIHRQRPASHNGILLNAGTPDDGAGAERVAGAERDSIALDGRHCAVEQEIDAALSQVRGGILRKIRIKGRENAVTQLDERDGHIRFVDVEIPPTAVAEKHVELPGHLHPGEVAPDDHEVKQRPPLRRVSGRVGQLEHRDRPIAQSHRVGQAFHFVAVFTKSRHLGQASDTADRDHEMVIANLLFALTAHQLIADRLPLEIDIAHLSHAEVG